MTENQNLNKLGLIFLSKSFASTCIVSGKGWLLNLCGKTRKRRFNLEGRDSPWKFHLKRQGFLAV
jgi:hypothetical protein